jgi:hypothetical protein
MPPPVASPTFEMNTGVIGVVYAPEHFAVTVVPGISRYVSRDGGDVRLTIIARASVTAIEHGRRVVPVVADARVSRETVRARQINPEVELGIFMPGKNIKITPYHRPIIEYSCRAFFFSSNN